MTSPRRKCATAFVALVTLVACQPASEPESVGDYSTRRSSEPTISGIEPTEPAQGLEALGTEDWELASARIDAVTVELTDQSQFTLRRSGDTQLSGDWSCNEWSANLVESGGHPDVVEVIAVASTAQYCGEESSEIEGRWARALVKVTTVESMDDVFVLHGDGVELVFSRSE